MTASSMIATSVARLSLCLAPLFLFACLDDDAELLTLEDELSDAAQPSRADTNPTGMDVTTPPATPRAAQFAGELQLSYPDALCNDGSAPVVHVKLDPNGGTNWLVYLQGGGSCDSDDSCEERWLDCTAGPDGIVGWHGNMVADTIDPLNPPNFDNRGILDFDGDSGEPSPFAGQGFNRVFVPYCSSDQWRGLGNTQTVSFAASCGDPALTTLHFGGGRIVEGVIDEIMNSAQAPEAGDFIVLAGGSAGGAGVQYNLERVATQVQTIDAGITVVGVADAAYTVGLNQSGTPGTVAVDSELYWAADSVHTAGDAIDVVVNNDCWTTEVGADKDFCHVNWYVVPNHMQQSLLLTTNSYDNTSHGPILDALATDLMAECGVTIVDTGGVDPDQDAFYDDYCVPVNGATLLATDLEEWTRYQHAIDGAAILNTTTNIAYHIVHSSQGLHDQLLKDSASFYRPSDDAAPLNALGNYEFGGLGAWTSSSGNNDDPSIATTVACALDLVGVPGGPGCVLADVRVTSTLPTNVSVLENFFN